MRLWSAMLILWFPGVLGGGAPWGFKGAEPPWGFKGAEPPLIIQGKQCWEIQACLFKLILL